MLPVNVVFGNYSEKKVISLFILVIVLLDIGKCLLALMDICESTEIATTPIVIDGH